MTARRVALGVVLLLALGAGAWRLGYERAARQAHWQARTDTVRVEIARLDTVYRADTLRLWRLVRSVDTLVRVDSIPVIAADSARADTSLRVLHAGLRSCVAALSTCETRVAAERHLRVLAESARVARPGPSPRPRGRVFWAGAAAGAGLVLLLRR